MPIILIDIPGVLVTLLPVGDAVVEDDAASLRETLRPLEIGVEVADPEAVGVDADTLREFARGKPSCS